jgi:hypothetical protein
VQRNCEWLDADGVFDANSCWYRMSELGWNRDEIGEGARPVHPERLFVRTDVAAAAATDVTSPARNIWLDHHVTARNVFGVAWIGNAANRLVAHDKRIVCRSAALKGCQIAAADSYTLY